MANTDSFLHLARPLGPAAVASQPSTAPLNVVIQPQAIFSILDHSLRRNQDQGRVIGTLLGVRSEDGTEVEIRNCYAVPHTETTEQVEVDMDYQKQMLALHLRANPREVLVGWYATSSELNTFSALIQNFYGQQGDGTYPHPAVHLTVSTIPGKDIEARTYISAPIGVTPERAADSCLFTPVPHEIKYGEADRSGLETIALAKDKEDRSQDIITDIEALEKAIESVLEMLERVSNYVNNVLDEEAPPSSALGQFLMNTLSLAPKVEAADIERDLYVPGNPQHATLTLLTLFTATTTFKTFSSSPTSPTPFAHRSTFPTDWLPLLSPWAVVMPVQAETARVNRKTATENEEEATTEDAGAETASKTVHLQSRPEYQKTLHPRSHLIPYTHHSCILSLYSRVYIAHYYSHKRRADRYVRLETAENKRLIPTKIIVAPISCSCVS